jgi:hypothetical protein
MTLHDASLQDQIISMDRANVQAIVHPTWGAPPQRLADIGPSTEGEYTQASSLMATRDAALLVVAL